jgi:hypothetical protein
MPPRWQRLRLTTKTHFWKRLSKAMTAHCSRINPEYHTLGAHTPQPVKPDAREEELRAAYQRIERLEADLLECLEYFEDRYDAIDGPYGEPAPNTEMRLGTMIYGTLNGRPF